MAATYSGATYSDSGATYSECATDQPLTHNREDDMPGQNQFLLSLSPTVFALLRPLLKPTEFPSSRVLFATGDEVTEVYFLQSGAVSLVTALRDGKMIESAMVGRDGIVGGGFALGGGHAGYTAIVEVAGRGHCISIEAASRIARENEEFRTAIIGYEQFVLAQAQQSAACNVTHDLQARLARWLLRVRDVTGSDSFVLTQESIAEMLGVGRTSVSITAHTMRQAGLISYRRGQIRVETFDGLRDMACECYGVIRMRYDRLAPPGQPVTASSCGSSAITPAM
jgi:CRP-like cAMP-binding protein